MSKKRAGDFSQRSKSRTVARIEVSRTLVKSPPELWAELGPECLAQAVGEVKVSETEPERALSWEGQGIRGTAVLEPAGWGTKVTLTAEVEEVVADYGFWAKLRGYETPAATQHTGIEEKLEGLLDDLGSAHRRPFSRGD